MTPSALFMKDIRIRDVFSCGKSFRAIPLRKDYEQEDADILETADIAWLEARGIKIPDEMKEKAKALQAAGQRAIAQKPEKPRS